MCKKSLASVCIISNTLNAWWVVTNGEVNNSKEPHQTYE
jgi:hypothetical protein